MSDLEKNELEAFETELRRFRPLGVAPLPLRSSAPASWAVRAFAVAAVLVITTLVVWLFRPHPHSTHHEDVAISEPLTEIRARTAIARGASVEDLAPLPTQQQHAHGISALEVLSQE